LDFSLGLENSIVFGFYTGATLLLSLPVNTFTFEGREISPFGVPVCIRYAVVDAMPLGIADARFACNG
jgi:hypothetical protein